MPKKSQFEQLVAALQKQPPISIEFYPLEIYFMAQSCLMWLRVKPQNKMVNFLVKKLKVVLTNRYPYLQQLISELLAVRS